MKYQSAVWYLPVPLRCQALESEKQGLFRKGFSLVACKDLVFVYLIYLLHLLFLGRCNFTLAGTLTTTIPLDAYVTPVRERPWKEVSQHVGRTDAVAMQLISFFGESELTLEHG